MRIRSIRSNDNYWLSVAAYLLIRPYNSINSIKTHLYLTLLTTCWNKPSDKSDIASVANCRPVYFPRLVLCLCFPWKCFIAYFTLAVSLTSFTLTHTSEFTKYAYTNQDGGDQTSKWISYFMANLLNFISRQLYEAWSWPVPYLIFNELNIYYKTILEALQLI